MKVKETVDPLGGEVGRMMAVNRKKAELLSYYLASVIFTQGKSGPTCQKLHNGEQKRNAGQNKELMREYLIEFKYPGLDGFYILVY